MICKLGFCLFKYFSLHKNHIKFEQERGLKLCADLNRLVTLSDAVVARVASVDVHYYLQSASKFATVHGFGMVFILKMTG